MKNKYLWISITLLTGFYTACTNVRFDKKANLTQYGGQCQQVSDSVVQCSGSESVAGGKVDVLFVNDNSASMSFEQARLAQRFNNFVSLLDNKFMDYRIAVTTTDISGGSNTARAVNQNGALQDGKLIGLSNGKKYISLADGSLSTKNSLFNSVINRPETLACESFIKAWVASGQPMENNAEYNGQYFEKCPSTDERGIYAANLVVQNNPDDFIRPEADLAVIFLADEDERSQLYDPYYSVPGYPLENFDQSTTLVTHIRQKYPNKSFGVHAIVVKDQACLTQQKQQISGVVNGTYGWEYHRTVQAAQSAMKAMGYSDSVVSQMVTGDICSSDYTSQLQQVFSHIQGQIKDSINFGCDNPFNVQVSLSANDPSITWAVEGQVLKFNKKLAAGTTVSYSYSCNF